MRRLRALHVHARSHHSKAIDFFSRKPAKPVNHPEGPRYVVDASRGSSTRKAMSLRVHEFERVHQVAV
jgi:hypothetical protein